MNLVILINNNKFWKFFYWAITPFSSYSSFLTFSLFNILEDGRIVYQAVLKRNQKQWSQTVSVDCGPNHSCSILRRV